MITELKDRREYTNNPRKAINIHSVRYYIHPESYSIHGFEDGTKSERIPFIMVTDRNLSTVPSYFTYYFIDDNGKVIYGGECQGATTWKQAEKWLNDYLSKEE